MEGYLAYYPTRSPQNVKDIYDADVAALVGYRERLAGWERGAAEAARFALGVR